MIRLYHRFLFLWEFRMIDRSKNISGQRFGRLVVLRRTNNYVKPSGTKVAQWLCQCDCGNKVIVRGDSLRSGVIKSCGCLHSECAKKQGHSKKKYNHYDLSGMYGIGYTSNTNEPFLFDLEDYDKIKKYCWCINNNGYILAPQSSTGKNILLHRLIMNPSENELVDHIQHRKFDNRKSKLRIVNKNQNAMNAKLPSNNTSGTKGVYWTKSCNKWCASIKINQNNICLGHYENFEDAVKVRKEAEEKYFGKYSYDNSMKG